MCSVSSLKNIKVNNSFVKKEESATPAGKETSVMSTPLPASEKALNGSLNQLMDHLLPPCDSRVRYLKN